ncbi:cytochrome P450 [Macrolepiota fuliginosa MF-IS2]|uniref:Cytochrome P450 n=1 Tax=Macrolepiota fuliginosa MF-IS2 TaxID=1400762 RepID=A0A9P6BX83_9AGAR|nr:cytochrome P450 [Macrolepiota fuliginosa MF-IS2]
MGCFPLDMLPATIAGIIVHVSFKRDERVTQLSRLFLLLAVVPCSVNFLFADPSRSLLYGLSRTFLVFNSTLASSIVLYRLSPWHPLARYPGPTLCKMSKLYWALTTRSGQQYKLLAALHEQYGEIVRIGPNEVSIANAACIEPLMGPSGLSKGQFWEGRAPESAPVKTLVGLRNKKEHTRRRKPWIRALSPMSIRYYESFLISRASQMVELLMERASGPIDLSQWLSHFSFDVMSDLVFGEGPEMMKNGDRENIWHLLDSSQSTLFFFGLVPWVGKLMFRASYFLPILPSFQRYRDYAVNRVMKRRKRGSPHKDLFYHLIDEDSVLEDKPTLFEVLSDSSLAIIAGADTITSALVSAFYFMMRYPKVCKRVQRDVDSLGDDFLNTQKQAQLQYVNAVISETLRLWPPVLSGSQREVKKGTGNAVIGPYILPEGTAASISFALVHKDPRNFAPYPEAFIPERWLPEDQRGKLEPAIFADKDAYRLNQNAFLTFSYGPANCIGKQLAWVEMRMVICLLTRQFDFEFAPGYDPSQFERDIRDYYIMVKGALPTVLSPRH